MYWELYLALMMLASACTLIVLVVRESIIPLGMAASGLWSILALQARSITIYHQDGSSSVVGSEPWQYIALGLALLSLATVILYWWDAFPPEDDEIIEQETV